MKRHMERIPIIVCALCLSLTACGKTHEVQPTVDEIYTSMLSKIGGRNTVSSPNIPDYTGNDILSYDTADIDFTHTTDGYLIFTYKGSADKVVFQITQPDGTRYPYPITGHEPTVLSLVSGDGEYELELLEHKSDNKYVTSIDEYIDVDVKNEFTAFLYPNQYTNYDESSECVQIAKTISDHSQTDIEFVSNVYDYTMAALSYDYELAENIGTNYIPDPDTTLLSGKGICFDYASLMASMLKSQNIPTKLEVGYAGTAYHAWISVYIEEIGWIDNIIQFDGKNWSFMDPTFADNSDRRSKTKQLIGDGSTYVVQYHY